MDIWRQNLRALMNQNEENDMDEIEEDVILELLIEHHDEIPVAKRGGSLPGKKPNVNRNRQAGAEQIFRDYFALNSTYDDRLFRRRFRMRRVLFNKLVAGIANTDNYFLQKCDALGVRGLSTLQKVVAAHRQICYGSAADSMDEYIRIGESTALQCLSRFCAAVVQKFGPEYLREPTRYDIERWLEVNKHRGFPGMFGSLDCTHWVWKSCPVSWQGQYQDRKGQRSIILEAVCTKDLWIWHWYFGLPGSNNDINVVDRSPLLLNMLKRHRPQVEYTVNNNEYKMAYLLTDGIYPNYHCFMKTISEPQGEKRQHYAKVQEAARKDIERCFGVLKARFALFCNPSRLWSQETMKSVVAACIIMHNMICEDEREESTNSEFLFENYRAPEQAGRDINFETLRTALRGFHNPTAYFQLRDDIVDHQWTMKGLSLLQI